MSVQTIGIGCVFLFLLDR